MGWEPDGTAGHALVPSNGPVHEQAWQLDHVEFCLKLQAFFGWLAQGVFFFN